MKKDKEWLLHEFRTLPYKLQRGHGKVKVVDILPLIDQLDEPRKVVIPQFVADYIDKSREEAYSLYGAFDKMPKEVANWLIDSKSERKSEGQDTFARAWLDGYEIEKEKLYYVIDKSKRPILTTYEGKVTPSVSASKVERAEKLSSPVFKYRLTEKQIKDYDERFWPFAVEVEE